MDPLSDVLSLLKPRNYLSAGLEAGGDWAIQFPDQQAAIKCGAVVSGRCWLSVEGVTDAVHLEAGDCFLLPRGRPFRLASDLGLPLVDAKTVFSPARTGGITTHKGGGDFLLVSSRFALSGDHAGILLRMLPPIVHIRGDGDHPVLRWPVERMMQELRERRPGGFLIVEHLAHMILIEALRLHMKADGNVGWLFALTDRQIGAAIGAMHEDPAHGWTLQTLAERAGMSRSTFALKFKQTVGASPLDYLTRWRMMLAGDRLMHSSDPVSVIALALGYESESAFSTAFKRVMGCSPRQYSRRDTGAQVERAAA
jgi:AraC-like DNA-binding protein